MGREEVLRDGLATQRQYMENCYEGFASSRAGQSYARQMIEACIESGNLRRTSMANQVSHMTVTFEGSQRRNILSSGLEAAGRERSWGRADSRPQAATEAWQEPTGNFERQTRLA